NAEGWAGRRSGKARKLGLRDLSKARVEELAARGYWFKHVRAGKQTVYLRAPESGGEGSSGGGGVEQQRWRRRKQQQWQQDVRHQMTAKSQAERVVKAQPRTAQHASLIEGQASAEHPVRASKSESEGLYAALASKVNEKWVDDSLPTSPSRVMLRRRDPIVLRHAQSMTSRPQLMPSFPQPLFFLWGSAFPKELYCAVASPKSSLRSSFLANCSLLGLGVGEPSDWSWLQTPLRHDIGHTWAPIRSTSRFGVTRPCNTLLRTPVSAMLPPSIATNSRIGLFSLLRADVFAFSTSWRRAKLRTFNSWDGAVLEVGPGTCAGDNGPNGEVQTSRVIKTLSTAGTSSLYARGTGHDGRRIFLGHPEQASAIPWRALRDEVLLCLRRRSLPPYLPNTLTGVPFARGRNQAPASIWL
ncbi:hypothetical protein C8R47DRAFT_1084047, partial [Mycena vitilis]